MMVTRTVGVIVCVLFVSGDALTNLRFAAELKELVRSECSLDAVGSAYQRLINEGTITLELLKPLHNVKEYASKLSELFSKKAAALEEVVQDVEEEAAKYPWNPLLKNISFTSLTDFDPNLERHHYFDIPVNQSQSGVYLPAEVYINDSLIAHQVDWTSNTDYIFKRQNDTLNFIYFASVYGFLRIYPRFQWPLDDKIRALDARRRSWYTQYTSVPKDVLFLVDTSGSMHGQALHLVNTSLRLLIQNLNRNDFFAVAKFPADRNHPAPTLLYGCSQNESCYNLLVQATSQNKQHAIQNVFRLVAENGANYDEAIFFGLKLMSSFSSGRSPAAHCNRILVLISDGDIYYNETTVQALRKYRHYVRLFTYSLSTLTAPGPLDKLAREINGTFAHIPVIGAMSNILWHFTENAELRRPIRNSKAQKMELVVHQAADIFPTTIAEEIGPMASLTLAVYNRTGSLNLLGIMGTDVSGREMVDLLQTYINSPTDYAFILDNNGYVIFHPLLKSYRRMSSYFVDVDLIDIEAAMNPEMLQLRNDIIDNKEGVAVVEDFALFLDEIHAHRTARTYAHAPIPDTNYSICIVTAEPRDIDVQYMSQKEKLSIDPVFGTILVENKDTSTLLQSVNVVISSTLAKCRTPSFSRILSQTTTTRAPATPTAERSPDQIESVDVVTSTDDLTSSNLTEAQFTGVGGSSSSAEIVKGGKTSGSQTGDAQETQEDLYSDLPPLSRRRRGWFEEVIADDPTGVAQINSILKFILSTDFGNHYYDGHFLSDLIAGLTVIEDWESHPMSENVVSRSVFFTSGLGFIYPAKLHGFEEDLTADFANSSLWQRVLDSQGLLFWIQPKMEDPTLPAPILSHITPGNKTMVNGSDTLILPMPNTTNMWTEVPVFEATIPIAPLPRVTIFKGISASQNAISNTFAVAGLTLKETYLQSKLSEFPECHGDKVCYLLDDAALILAANKPALNYQVGHFLGSADPWLMQELLNNLVYSRVKYYDYQSVCDTTELADRNCTSPATRLIPSLLRGLEHTLNPRVWLNFLMVCFEVALKLVRVCITLSQLVLGAAGHSGRGDYMSCIKSSYRYYATDGAIFVTSAGSSSSASANTVLENETYGGNAIPTADNETEYIDDLPLPPEGPAGPVTSGIFNCSESCSRAWSATPIPETNTKLVVVDPVCPCAPNDMDWQLSPSLAKDITVCEDMQNPRYRRPVQTCTPS
nr:unnamed protein product [Spirometra erinaceieuropaei]